MVEIALAVVVILCGVFGYIGRFDYRHSDPEVKEGEQELPQ